MGGHSSLTPSGLGFSRGLHAKNFMGGHSSLIPSGLDFSRNLDASGFTEYQSPLTPSVLGLRIFLRFVELNKQTMIKAIIVEDEPRDREVLQKALLTYCKDIDIVGNAGSVSDAEKIVKERPAELLFLDIELPDGRAFDLLEKIKDVPIKIIFTTAHPEYAVKAFRFSAVDYLLKPVSFTELQNAVDKVKQGIQLETEKNKIQFLLEGIRQNIATFKKIAIPDRKSVKFIPINDIIFIEADHNYSRFVISGNSDLISCHNLKEYEDMLAEHCFTRISKSHVVNLNHLAEYKTCGEIVTDSGIEIPVGRQYKENLLKKMNT